MLVWEQAPFLNIMMSAVSASLNEQLQSLKKGMPGLNYQRYQKRLPNDIEMDDTNHKIVAKLQQLGEELVAENRKQLDELCRALTESGAGDAQRCLA